MSSINIIMAIDSTRMVHNVGVICLGSRMLTGVLRFLGDKVFSFLCKSLPKQNCLIDWKQLLDFLYILLWYFPSLFGITRVFVYARKKASIQVDPFGKPNNVYITFMTTWNVFYCLLHRRSALHILRLPEYNEFRFKPFTHQHLLGRVETYGYHQ
jgi:hypothetical protein